MNNGQPIIAMTQLEADGTVSVHCSECCGDPLQQNDADNRLACATVLASIPADAVEKVPEGYEGEPKIRPAHVARLWIRGHMRDAHGF